MTDPADHDGRRARLAELVARGTRIAIAPLEVYDRDTREMLDSGPVGRYLCVTAEDAHRENPDYCVCDDLEAVEAKLTGDLGSGEYAWSPLDVVDLDTGESLDFDVRAVVQAGRAALVVPVVGGGEARVTLTVERDGGGAAFVRLDCADGFRLAGDAPGDYYVEPAPELAP